MGAHKGHILPHKEKKGMATPSTTKKRKGWQRHRPRHCPPQRRKEKARAHRAGEREEEN